jgi:hypothetical protein
MVQRTLISLWLKYITASYLNLKITLTHWYQNLRYRLEKEQDVIKFIILNKKTISAEEI